MLYILIYTIIGILISIGIIIHFKKIKILLEQPSEQGILNIFLCLCTFFWPIVLIISVILKLKTYNPISRAN